MMFEIKSKFDYGTPQRETLKNSTQQYNCHTNAKPVGLQ